VGQEPELLDPNTSVPTRIEGNNIRNTGTLTLDTIWTRLLSTQLSYGNTVFDYQNNNGTAALPSRAGLLNRVEQTISLDLQWAISPQTMAFVGGELGWVNYTADEPIANGPTGPLFSDARDNRSYIAYVGAQHTFFANLNFTGKVGIQYTDAYNALSGGTSLNPYADLSLIYTYLPGSYVQAGFTQSENTSDVADPNASGQTTLFTESSTIYLSLNQKLTSKIMGSGIARWQHSVYNGGAFDNKADDYYSFGVNLSYTFNPHFSAEAGYNFDDVQSQVGNQYTRSRVYLGVTAAY